MRVLQGFGLDVSSPNTKVQFPFFCRLKAFLVFYTIEEAELVRVWPRILNPASAKTQSSEEVWNFFERFSRGNSLAEPTVISRTFANQMLELLAMEGCIEQSEGA
jgi:hypothetical protein